MLASFELLVWAKVTTSLHACSCTKMQLKQLQLLKHWNKQVKQSTAWNLGDWDVTRKSRGIESILASHGIQKVAVQHRCGRQKKAIITWWEFKKSALQDFGKGTVSTVLSYNCILQKTQAQMCLPNKAVLNTGSSIQNLSWTLSRSLQTCRTLSCISTAKDVMKSVAYHSKYALLFIKLL